MAKTQNSTEEGGVVTSSQSLHDEVMNRETTTIHVDDIEMSDNVTSDSAYAAAPNTSTDDADDSVTSQQPQQTIRRLVPVKRWKGVELETMSREDLIARVRSLERNVESFRNIVQNGGVGKSSAEPRVPKKKGRAFDFNKYNTRHVALQVAYFGWDYIGKKRIYISNLLHVNVYHTG